MGYKESSVYSSEIKVLRGETSVDDWSKTIGTHPSVILAVAHCSLNEVKGVNLREAGTFRVFVPERAVPHLLFRLADFSKTKQNPIVECIRKEKTPIILEGISGLSQIIQYIETSEWRTMSGNTITIEDSIPTVEIFKHGFSYKTKPDIYNLPLRDDPNYGLLQDAISLLKKNVPERVIPKILQLSLSSISVLQLSHE